jgi:general secretion pathway protein M
VPRGDAAEEEDRGGRGCKRQRRAVGGHTAMSLRERLDRLEDRERRLLGIALAILLAGAILLPPVSLFAYVHAKKSEVEDVRAAIQSILDEEEALERARAQLQAFLARLASEAGVEIPESQDRQVVPRGKRFEERSTKITLRKVGMLKLVKFLEKIVQSGHPVRITQFDVRKRGSEPDSYDVDMIVSAFDRKAPEPKAGAGRDAGAPGAADAGSAKDDDEGEP